MHKLKAQAGVAAGILAVVVAVVAVANFANLQLSGNAVYILKAGTNAYIDPDTFLVSPCVSPSSTCAEIYLDSPSAPSRIGPVIVKTGDTPTDFQMYGYNVFVSSIAYTLPNNDPAGFQVGLDITKTRTPTPTTTPTPVTAGLVVHLALDEPTAACPTNCAAASDSAGGDDLGSVLDYAGSPASNPTWVQARIRNGLQIPTANFYHIKVQPSARINSLSRFTSAIWFNQKVSGVQTLIKKGDFSLYTHSFSTLPNIKASLGTTECDSGVPVSLNTWYHAAVAYDSSNIQIYVNGQLKKTCAVTGATTGTTEMYIGAETPSTSIFKGILDDVRIYNSALSAAEISGLIPAASPTPTATNTPTPTPTATAISVSGITSPTSPVVIGNYKIYASSGGAIGGAATITVRDSAGTVLGSGIVFPTGSINFDSQGLKVTVNSIQGDANNQFVSASITVESYAVSPTPTPTQATLEPKTATLISTQTSSQTTDFANHKITAYFYSPTEITVRVHDSAGAQKAQKSNLKAGDVFDIPELGFKITVKTIELRALSPLGGPITLEMGAREARISGTAGPTTPVLFGSYKIYAETMKLWLETEQPTVLGPAILVKDSSEALLTYQIFSVGSQLTFAGQSLKVTVNTVSLDANNEVASASITVESILPSPRPAPKDVLAAGADIVAGVPEPLALSGQGATGILEATIETSVDIPAADASIEITQEAPTLPAFPSPDQAEFKILRFAPSAGLTGKISDVLLKFSLAPEELGATDPSTIVLGRFAENSWEEFPTWEAETRADGSKAFISFAPPELGLLVIATRACMDYDWGADANIKGKIRGLEAIGVADTSFDYCGTAGPEIGKLVEYTCGPGYFVQKSLIDCAAGCSEGACEPEPQKLVQWTFEADTMSGIITNDIVKEKRAVMHDGDSTAFVEDAPARISSQGVFGQAVKFDGLDDSLYIQDDAQSNIGLINPKGLTVSAWVFLDSRAGAPFKTILAKSASTADPLVLYSLNLDRDNKKATFALSKGMQGSLAAAVSEAEIPLNKWALLTGTWDGQSIKIYVNGRPEGSASFSGPLGASEKPIFIGSGEVAGATNFDGQIDDVQIYNYGLESQAVSALCAGKCPVEVSATVFVQPQSINDEPIGNWWNSIVSICNGKWGLDPYWVSALVKKESWFDPAAFNAKEKTAYESGADVWYKSYYGKGLTQVTGPWVAGVPSPQIIDAGFNLPAEAKTDEAPVMNDPYNGNQNLERGCWYFKALLSRYNGNYLKAAAAYHYGWQGVDARQFTENDEYPQKVKQYKDEYLQSIASPTPTPSASPSTSPSPIASPSEPPVRLLAIWKADEGEGTEVKDYSKRGNHLTIKKDGSEILPSWIEGRFEEGLGFDGANGLVSISGKTELNPSDITVSAWVQTKDTGSIRGVVSRGATLQETDEELDYALAIDRGTAKFIVTSPEGAVYQALGTQVADGNWHLLTGIYDSKTRELKVYVDGSLKDTTTSASMSLQSTNIVVGGGGGTTNKLKGLIDEVRIYKGALSDKMVEILYNKYTKGLSKPDAASAETAKSVLDASEDAVEGAPIELVVPADVAAKAGATKIKIEVSRAVPKAEASLEVKALDKIPQEDDKKQKLEGLPLVEQPLTKIMQLAPSSGLSPAITRATITFRLSKGEIGSADPSAVVLARFVNGGWEELPTRAFSPSADGSVEFTATSPGFSVFVVTSSVSSTLPTEPAASPAPTPAEQAQASPAPDLGPESVIVYSPTPKPQNVQTKASASPEAQEITVQAERPVSLTARPRSKSRTGRADYSVYYIVIIIVVAMALAGGYLFIKKRGGRLPEISKPKPQTGPLQLRLYKPMGNSTKSL